MVCKQAFSILNTIQELCNFTAHTTNHHLLFSLNLKPFILEITS